MARRSFLPPHIQAELPQRARYGVGHDMSAPTLHFGESLTAYTARTREPSPEMMAVIKSIGAWVESRGGKSVGILIDIRHAKHSGCITVSWDGGPSAFDVATQFAVGYDTDGLPLIPGWLSLKNEDDWDLRWQPTYGEIVDPAQQVEAPQTTSATVGAPVVMEAVESTQLTIPGMP